MKNRPMKGFIQVLQVLLFFVGGIIIIAIIVNKSPASLFAGLGASAAILMLVFKDSILGFVAGIQLSANDMVRPGDSMKATRYILRINAFVATSPNIEQVTAFER